MEQVNGQSLSLLANSYRDGDWLDKVQVSFNEQVVGEKYVWTIAKVKDKSLPPDSYRILNDTVCCTRRGVRTYFYQNAQNISIIDISIMVRNWMECTVWIGVIMGLTR